MSHNKALLLAAATFVVFSAAIIGLFALLDVRQLFAVGPVIAVGIASLGVYRGGRKDRIG